MRRGLPSPYVLAVVGLIGPGGDAIPNAPVTSYANAGEIAGVAQVGSARLSVALYSEAIPPDGPRPMLIPGATLGVVYFLPPRPPVTLAAVSAEGIVGPFRDALTNSERPVESPAVRIVLPAGSAAIAGWLGDIVLFDDRNRNGQLETSESYASAWTGGTGGYRLVYVAEPRQDHPGAERGWNLMEGGFPATYHSDLIAVRVLIDPVVRPVPGAGTRFLNRNFRNN